MPKPPQLQEVLDQMLAGYARGEGKVVLDRVKAIIIAVAAEPVGFCSSCGFCGAFREWDEGQSQSVSLTLQTAQFPTRSGCAPNSDGPIDAGRT